MHSSNSSVFCSIYQVLAYVLCITCWYLQVSGPSNATVEYFNYAQNSTSSYQLLVQWNDAYRGAVTVDLQSSRWGCHYTFCCACTTKPEDVLHVTLIAYLLLLHPVACSAIYSGSVIAGLTVTVTLT